MAEAPMYQLKMQQCLVPSPLNWPDKRLVRLQLLSDQASVSVCSLAKVGLVVMVAQPAN
jgi:hypothetical protein